MYCTYMRGVLCSNKNIQAYQYVRTYIQHVYIRTCVYNVLHTYIRIMHMYIRTYTRMYIHITHDLCIQYTCVSHDCIILTGSVCVHGVMHWPVQLYYSASDHIQPSAQCHLLVDLFWVSIAEREEWGGRGQSAVKNAHTRARVQEQALN